MADSTVPPTERDLTKSVAPTTITTTTGYVERYKYNGPFGLSKDLSILVYLIFTFILVIGAVGLGVSLYYILSDSTKLAALAGAIIGAIFIVAALILFIIFGCDHWSHALYVKKSVLPIYRKKKIKKRIAQKPDMLNVIPETINTVSSNNINGIDLSHKPQNNTIVERNVAESVDELSTKASTHTMKTWGSYNSRISKDKRRLVEIADDLSDFDTPGYADQYRVSKMYGRNKNPPIPPGHLDQYD